MQLVRIPKAFLISHLADFPPPALEIVKVTTRHFYISADDPALRKLLAMADRYAGWYQFSWDYRAKARATSKAIRAGLAKLEL